MLYELENGATAPHLVSTTSRRSWMSPLRPKSGSPLMS